MGNPEKVIKIVVEPPFWMTYYAYLFYAIAIALTVWEFVEVQFKTQT
jgi:hypothetical protein